MREAKNMLNRRNVVQVQRTFDDIHVKRVHHTDQILLFLHPSAPIILLAYTHQVKDGACIEGEACQLCLVLLGGDIISGIF